VSSAEPLRHSRTSEQSLTSAQQHAGIASSEPAAMARQTRTAIKSKQPPDSRLSHQLRLRKSARRQDRLRQKGSQKIQLLLDRRVRGAQPFDTRTNTSPTRESRPTHQILKHRFRFALEIDTTSSGRTWAQTPSVLIELMGALARGGTPGDRRATRGVPGFSQKKGPGNLTSLSLPLKGAAFCQQFHGDPSTACFTPFATHLSN